MKNYMCCEIFIYFSKTLSEIHNVWNLISREIPTLPSLTFVYNYFIYILIILNNI